MKHVKTYETQENKNKYKKGDYIYININNWRFKYKPKPYCKIINHMDTFDPNIHLKWIEYLIEIFNEEENKFTVEFIEEDEIIRKLTEDEIKLFNQLKQTTKYNL